jgi:hypothetical protein
MIMKRLFHLILFLTISTYTSFGQNLVGAEYFLDTDPGLGKGTVIGVTPAGNLDQNFSVSATGLSVGLHKLFIRVRQDDGFWGVPKTRFFYVFSASAVEVIQFSTEIVGAEYFYDSDPGVGNGMEIPIQKTSSIDKNWVAKTTGLAEGEHVLYIRTKSLDGFWGTPNNVTVNINNLVCQMPDVAFDYDSVDINTNVGLIDQSINVDPLATYEWDVLNDGSIESTSKVFDTQFPARGVYPIKLTISNPDGCTARIINDIYVSGGFDTNIQFSQDSLFHGNTTILDAPVGYTYQWNTKEIAQSIEVSEPGSYFVFLTADGITYKSETINVRFFSPITADFNSYHAKTGLNNGAAILENIDSDGLPYTITWSTGASNVESVNNLAAGSYSVDITTPLATYTYPFIINSVTPTDNSLVRAEYFIGSDPGPGNGTPIPTYQGETLNVNFNLDVSGLTIGLHNIYVRVKKASGLWSIPESRYIYVIDPNVRVYEELDRNLTEAEYFIDQDPGIGNGFPLDLSLTKNANVDFSYTVSELGAGLHDIYVRTKQDDGLWSTSIPTTFFVIGGRFKEIITFKTDIIAAEYFIDQDPGVGKGERLPVQKSQAINNRPWAVKTDGLSIGNHSLYIRIQSQVGLWNTVSVQPFTITDEICATPIADFAFDTVGVDTMIGITDLSTALSGDVTYAWDVFGDGIIESTSPTFDTSFSQKGIYPLKLTVVNLPDSCFSSVVKDIVISDGINGQIVANKRDSLLVGDSITFTAPPGLAYEWSNGEVSQSITVGVSGSYFVWLTADNITFKSEVVSVNYFKEIAANIEVYGFNVGLDNGAASLSITEAGGLPTKIVWSTGVENITQISGLAEGNYSVEISNKLDTVFFIFAIVENQQTTVGISEAEYFVNTDPGPGKATRIVAYQSEKVDFDFTLDVSGLPIGIQKLYLRTKQANGLWGVPKVRFFYVIDPAERIYEELDRNALGAEYYVDVDPGIGKGIPIAFSPTKNVDENFTLVTDGISPGIHGLFLRTHQNDGLWSSVMKVPFFLADTVDRKFVFLKTDIVAAEYFFDVDPGIGKGLEMPIQKTDSLWNRPWAASTVGLSAGKHTLNIRLQNQLGLWNIIESKDVFIYQSDCNLPNADFSFDSVGVNTNIGLADLSSNVETGATYQWDLYGDESIESTRPDFDTLFAENGVYPIKLTMTNSEGCFTSKVHDVIVSSGFPGGLVLSGNDSLLVGEILTITAPAGYGYEWNNDETTQSIDVKEIGQYFAYLSSSGINFKTEKINVAFFEQIKATLEVFNSTSGLTNGAASITGLDSGELPYTINWSTGQKEKLAIQDLSIGSYSVDIITTLETKTFNFDIVAESPASGSIARVEYFLDADPGIGLGTPIQTYQNSSVSFKTPVVMSGVSEGHHYIYFRAKNVEGLWGSVVRKSFYILEPGLGIDLAYGGNIIYAEYAFDDLPVPGTGNAISFGANTTLDESLAIDISGLPNGPHELFIQMQDESGNWSFSKPESFVICANIPAAPSAGDVLGCEPGNHTITVSGVEGKFNWYNADKDFIANTTSSNRTFSSVMETTTYYVSQVNAEGCESAMTEVSIIINDAEIYAGPDVDTYSTLKQIQLKDQFPAGGIWSGSTFLTVGGVFRPKDAGVGSFQVFYSKDSLGCTLKDALTIHVLPISNNPPEIIDQSFTVVENSIQNIIVGQVIATDIDSTILTYTIISGDSKKAFGLSNEGVLSVSKPILFDFETIPFYDLKIEVSDGFFKASATVRVDLIDVPEQISEADSLILVEFYQSTGGANWTNKAGWLVQPIAQWFGVTADLASVISIDLVGNNLSGTIPESIVNISSLMRLNVSDNSLTSIPDLSLVPDLGELNVNNNKLQFGHIEPLLGITTLTYAPQKEALESIRALAEINVAFSIDRQIIGSSVTYSWFKDSNPISVVGPTYNFTPLSFEDEAIYTVQATSDLVPNLTINIAPVDLKISSLQRDRLALLAIYDAMGGASWTVGSNWPSLIDITTWQGINVTSNRVISLNLANNNLSGILPVDINDLEELTSINLSGNKITGLPKITLKGQTLLNLSNNLLDFEDLIPNVGVDGIVYAPQSLFGGRVSSDTVAASTNHILNGFLAGAKSYEWYFDPFTTIVEDFTKLPNQNGPTLEIQNLTYDKMGAYRVIASNQQQVPGLTITSYKKFVWAYTEVSGQIRIGTAPLTTGADVALFRIKSDGAYDSTRVVKTDDTGNYSMKEVVLGSFILKVDPDSDTQGNNRLVQTYYISQDDWRRADTLEVFSNQGNIDIDLKFIPPPLTGSARIFGVVESDLSDENILGESGGKISSRRKVKKAACSMRRFKAQGRDNQDDVETEIAYYIETDDEGFFNFEKVEEGRYLINIQFPGIPMDESASVEFVIGGDRENQVFEVYALITELGITITQDEILYNLKPYIKDIVLFPNPTEDLLSIDYTVYRKLENLKLKLLSITGEVLLEQDVDHNFGLKHMQLNMSDYGEGVYLLMFIDDLGTVNQTMKIVKQ